MKDITMNCTKRTEKTGPCRQTGAVLRLRSQRLRAFRRPGAAPNAPGTAAPQIEDITTMYS